MRALRPARGVASHFRRSVGGRRSSGAWEGFRGCMLISSTPEAAETKPSRQRRRWERRAAPPWSWALAPCCLATSPPPHTGMGWALLSLGCRSRTLVVGFYYEKQQCPLPAPPPPSPSLGSCPSQPDGVRSPAVANVLFASFRCVLLHPSVTPCDNRPPLGPSLIFLCIVILYTLYC